MAVATAKITISPTTPQTNPAFFIVDIDERCGRKGSSPQESSAFFIIATSSPNIFIGGAWCKSRVGFSPPLKKRRRWAKAHPPIIQLSHLTPEDPNIFVGGAWCKLRPTRNLSQNRPIPSPEVAVELAVSRAWTDPGRFLANLRTVNMLRYLTAGESHGRALLALVDGFPAGVDLNVDAIDAELVRRQGGYGRGGRQKIETDHVEVLSGVWRGVTLGSPIALLIPNKDFKIDHGRPRPAPAGPWGPERLDQVPDLGAGDPGTRQAARETTARVAAGQFHLELVLSNSRALFLGVTLLQISKLLKSY